MTDEEIIMKVGDLFSRMKKNEQLQKLTEENGLDVKNNVTLTDADKDNLAVSIVSLYLAQRENDPRYTSLVKMGLQKRSIKTSIVNSYKNQAMDIIEKYKSV